MNTTQDGTHLPDKGMGTGINVVLVHGSFVDASSWNHLIPLLLAQSYRVLAVQLPLSTLTEDSAITRQALASLSGPTILVGHSYGGAVITNAGADVPNLIGLVYASAYALEQGESVSDINAKYEATPGAKLFVESYRSGYAWLDPVAFPQNFMQDVPEVEAHVIAVSQRPAALASFSNPSGPPAWENVPSWYLVSTQDRIIHTDAERFMAKRIHATTIEVASSHASPVSHPNDVFNLIQAAARKK